MEKERKRNEGKNGGGRGLGKRGVCEDRERERERITWERRDTGRDQYEVARQRASGDLSPGRQGAATNP